MLKKFFLLTCLLLSVWTGVLAQDNVVRMVYGPRMIPCVVPGKKLCFMYQSRVIYNGEVLADDFDSYVSALRYCRETFGEGGYEAVSIV